ncbi:MAG TPA: Xaa-Pro peptidase family protein [Thermoanaerobaculia bacterium]|jgi:Xaa-Pro aminopeptidase|nr:Xaa-Pro peptidase family protein [Thermoanaerobaculia bacterium]
MRRLVLAFALALCAAAAIAQEGFGPFTTDFPPEEFAARRANVYDAIGDKAFAVVQGAPGPAGYTRFRQSNDFYYLCGIEVPHAYLLLDGATRKTTLFLPHRNEGREKGEGRTLSAEDADEVKKLSGVDAVFGTDLLAEQIVNRFHRAGLRILFTPLAPAEGASMSRDLALRSIADIGSDPFDGLPSREGRFVALVHERFPVFEVRDLTPVLDGLRLIKSPRELVLLRNATKLAGLAILEGMRSTRPGEYEHELDAVGKFVFWRNGAQGDAYFSLIASGHNAWWPHYNAGKRKMEDGDFLLMDYAPDYAYYEADVTRMFPVNGKFSQWQRELYGFYLACYRAILKHIRPEATAHAIMLEAAADMDGILASSKFSKEIYRKGAEDFVTKYKAAAGREDAALGHWVGMATHDDGPHAGPLKPGMVFTIEPALTVPEEKIYVRLEDMIFINDKGAEVVSTDAPWDIDAIEKAMKEEGMLKRYPRVIPPPGK